MSDYCGKCPLDPQKSPSSCPFTALYWSFLERHEDKLGTNQRMPYNTLRKKSAEEREALRERAECAIAQLERREIVDEGMPSRVSTEIFSTANERAGSRLPQQLKSFKERS